MDFQSLFSPPPYKAIIVVSKNTSLLSIIIEDELPPNTAHLVIRRSNVSGVA